MMAKQKETRERYEQHAFDLSGYARPPRRLHTTEDIVRLHEALEPFMDLGDLRRCVAEQRDVYEALRCDKPPQELRAIMGVLTAMLTPQERFQVRSPHDIAGMLMVEMSNLDQEEFRTVLLDTKNRLVGVHTVYRGTIDTSMIRVCEVFKEAIKRNSASMVISHNHPSGSVDPSPEDVLVTRSIVEAGKLLQIDILDHIIIGQGRWVSLREKGLGFS
jgi:DNA repair protein RadC